ncbi:MAG TPA: translation initiation factor IF-2 subunit alpha [Candidatus Altiarchaeales archaeon]|nr:translation initiation factor IF-2 subunit alpha [Candidatus Altiarchaeales archaeon]
MAKKDEYPEVGELVIGTVESVFKQGAFISLDEYGGKRGLLHISEISLRWVRNIRDYVKEGQKVVLMVLNVNPERGHIDLSLRRVTEAQRREKLKEVKRRQRAEKLLELFAKNMKINKRKVMKVLGEKLIDRFGSLYDGLESILIDDKALEQLDIPQEWKEPLFKLVKENIKSPYVTISGYIKLRTLKPNGVEHIKEALEEIEKFREKDVNADVMVFYESPPLYRLRVKAQDYKVAEKFLRKAAEKGIEKMLSLGGEAEFFRERPKIQEL